MVPIARILVVGVDVVVGTFFDMVVVTSALYRCKDAQPFGNE